ncbi:MAG: hypothetical protein ACD_7C00087G0004 [uncultured bacterium]|nr:MAG: hypothetical protein ACD_7C00087G0004 [uncultured bacterium]KKP67777.1 MAG: hypothetical protein UR66_C0010G0015 [Candidatus Moranbacteria bacterium GW2011_GWE1_35_17]KKP71911.1 MAG: hypothetical protein UR65_C0024G0007 [Candidatus Moranbacteria bacterium GW2011_GWE2_35_164]KKP83210.1 MAG: hypothetical protein UR83_C0038G0013 [Candidatus Moranbacteria bacterium GW2011_GWF2_35_54]HBR79829.1 hypothetical protein [Candidatus Moranbacteria bacterium]
MKNKSIIVLISVISLVLIAGVGFLFLKNKEGNNKEILQEKIIIPNDANQNKKEADIGEIDTSNWQVYKNEEYGFEVKYPENWKTKKFKSSCLGLGDCAIDCNKMPEECNIVGFSFYNENDVKLESTAISVVPENQKKSSELHNIKSEWMQGMFSGCYVTARINTDNNEFLLGSFRSATDLNDAETTQKENDLCERNMLNPLFNEMVKSFTAIN